VAGGSAQTRSRRLSLGRLDAVVFGLAGAVLLVSLVFGLLQIGQAARIEREVAIEQALSGLRTYAAFVQADLQSGHYRYVWKQLDRAVANGAIHCFVLRKPGGQLLVDDPAVSERCPPDLLVLSEDPSLPATQTTGPWVIHRSSVHPTDSSLGHMMLAMRSGGHGSLGGTNVAAVVTQVSVFLLCLLLGVFSIRWVYSRSMTNIRQVISDVADGFAPRVDAHGLVPSPVAGALAKLGAELVTIRQELVEKSKLAAVAQAAQTLAHDVRSPFSLFKVLLDTIPTIQDTESLVFFTKSAIPEVQRSMDTVDGLLQDIVQIGSPEAELHLDNVTPEHVIHEALHGVFRAQPESDVTIDWGGDPSLVLRVDENRIRRVFTNILLNACQAMSWRGRIWVTCRRKANHGDFLEFVIGNDRTFIPRETQDKLFEAFFTANKRGGTGLGLAIAKKWVLAHGGQIECRSKKTAEHPDGFVEFRFTVPCGTVNPSEHLARPQIKNHSSRYVMSIALECPNASTLMI
jgi:signal transduction histidine kinase